MVSCKKPTDCQNIDEIRDEIDKIDLEIIQLFTERNKYVDEIVKFKNDEESIIAQPRKDSVIRQIGISAKQHGLNPEVFEKIYSLLIEDNIKRELEILIKEK